MRDIILIAHDIRSTHNVGSLLRTAECFGIVHTYFTGYTPYPTTTNDERLPHISAKLTNQIHKTALGAETMTPWTHSENILDLISTLRAQGYTIAALEQTKSSVLLPNYQPPQKIALLIGREVEGIDTELLANCNITLEIPQFGKKESLNVVQATAIALYHIQTSS